jgi:predicted DCC family thiol-disulfide oxidoreductase YuxK
VRRLVNGLSTYAAELAAAVGRAWDSFFFKPADPTPLGLIRVLVGLLLFWSLAVYGLDLRAFFGSDGWANPATVRVMMAERSPWALSFWLWVPDGLLWPIWTLCLCVLALYTLGLGSRITAVLAWAIAVSTSRRVPVSLFGFDQIVTTWAFYLAMTGASGKAVSIDRFLSRWRQARADMGRRRADGRMTVAAGVPVGSVAANIGLRLIQLHLAFIYGMAGLSKLQGQSWWTGFAAWGVVASGEFRRFDLTWLAAFPLLLNLMTHVGLFLELSYPALIWVRVLRPLVIFCVALMHLGIDLTLGLTEFGLAMLAGNLAFVSGPWLRSLVAGRDQPAGRVLYDGACPRCRASIALITALDPDHVVEPIDLTRVDVATIHPSLTRARALKAMHLVQSDGRVLVGFDAFRTLALWLPAAWPLAVILVMPGVAWLGRRVYNHVADSRSRDFFCTDDHCGIHPGAAAPEGGHASTTASSGRSS